METNRETYEEILHRDPLLIKHLQMNLDNGKSKEFIIERLREVETQGISQGTTVDSIIKALEHMTALQFTIEDRLMVDDLKQDVVPPDNGQET